MAGSRKDRIMVGGDRRWFRPAMIECWYLYNTPQKEIVAARNFFVKMYGRNGNDEVESVAIL